MIKNRKTDEMDMLLGSKTIRILIACFGSFIGLVIIISSVCVFIGFEGHLKTIFCLLFAIGIPVWVLITWRYFSRQLN